MKLTGHKTESVYKRYPIVSEVDSSEGLAKLHHRDQSDVLPALLFHERARQVQSSEVPHSPSLETEPVTR